MTAAERGNVERYLHAKTNGRSRKGIDGVKLACEKCGAWSELEWHHRKYWSEGGTDEPENLCVLCKPCHVNEHMQKSDFRMAGRWGGLVSAYVRERRLGRKGFCESMRRLAVQRKVA